MSAARERRRAACRLRRARAHRHAARGRVLPPRRHPPVRAATAARTMSDAVGEGLCHRGRRPRAGVPGLLLDLLAARGPSGYEQRPGGRVARGGRQPSRRSAPTWSARRWRSWRRKHGAARAGAAAARDGPHRRDRADRHPHRRRGLPVVRAVGGWDAQILVGQRVVLDTRGRARAGRGGQEADPPAARGGPQEGRRDPRPAHRHRRPRRRARRASWCGSATSR